MSKHDSAIRRVQRIARLYVVEPELILLAAVVAQAKDDAARGDAKAAAWLRGVGF